MNPDAWNVLLTLLLAHFVTDFILQPDSWVRKKQEHGAASLALALHALLAGGLSWLLLWRWEGWLAAVIIAASHWLIDWLKVLMARERNLLSWEAPLHRLAHGKLGLAVKRDGVLMFFLDQALHLAVLAGVWVWFFGGRVGAAWDEVLAAAGPGRLLVLALGVVLVTGVGSVLVAMLTRHWQQEMEEAAKEAKEKNQNQAESKAEGEDRVQGLRQAGRWIGMLERLWILLFVLTGHWQAIGFLVAAKTVLRFKEITDGNDRKVAEYILVGTLMSFLWAVLVALSVRWGLEIVA